MDQYTAQKNQQAAYQRSLGSGLAGQALGTLHQNGDFEPAPSYGQIGVQTAQTQVFLTGQIASAHALADSLGEVVSGLEKRLSPILSSNYPPDGQKDGTAISCDPPAIEEMDRLLNRLRSVIAYVDSIERRTRI